MKRIKKALAALLALALAAGCAGCGQAPGQSPVSYTHQTLPTKRIV